MAIVQISRIQVRRGLQEELPQLASGEFGWSLDQRRLFIGNGTLDEGAPTEGLTEVLTEYSDLLGGETVYTFKGLSPGPQAITGTDINNPEYRTLQDKLDDFLSVKDYGAAGDGIVDDTVAINRALTRQSQAPTHRTIYFPAGTYRITSTINIPPFTKIQGDGKGSSVIIGTFNGPLAQLVDSFGQTGSLYGNPDTDGVLPFIEEYHLSDIALWQYCPTFDQPALLIDGAFAGSFTRVMFKGLLTGTTADYAVSKSATGTLGAYTFTTNNVSGLVTGMPIGWPSSGPSQTTQTVGLGGTIQSITGPVGGLYTVTSDVANYDNFANSTLLFSSLDNANPVFDIYRGSGIAGVYIPNRSQTQSVNNLIFNQCDFLCIGVGVEMNEDCHTLTFFDSYFDKVYHFVNVGNNTSVSSGSVLPYDITFRNNYFRYCANIGIYGHTGVNNLISSENTYIGYGTQDYLTNSLNAPSVVNPSGVAAYPAINFSGSKNFSVSDQFFDGGAFPTIPYVEDNGYVSYQFIHDIGVVNGRKTLGYGQSLTLNNAGSFTTTGISNYPGTYTNLVMDYMINHAGGKRTGRLVVSGIGGTYTTDEEYTEDTNVGVSLRANTTTGNIEYTSTTSGNAAILTYSLNYFRP
jgi:hypothetical protein